MSESQVEITDETLAATRKAIGRRASKPLLRRILEAAVPLLDVVPVERLREVERERDQGVLPDADVRDVHLHDSEMLDDIVVRLQSMLPLTVDRSVARAVVSLIADRLAQRTPAEGSIPSTVASSLPVGGEGDGLSSTDPEIEQVYALLENHFERGDPDEDGGPPTWGRSDGGLSPEWSEAGETGSTLDALRQIMEEEFVRGCYEDPPGRPSCSCCGGAPSVSSGDGTEADAWRRLVPLIARYVVDPSLDRQVALTSAAVGRWQSMLGDDGGLPVEVARRISGEAPPLWAVLRPDDGVDVLVRAYPDEAAAVDTVTMPPGPGARWRVVKYVPVGVSGPSGTGDPAVQADLIVQWLDALPEEVWALVDERERTIVPATARAVRDALAGRALTIPLLRDRVIAAYVEGFTEPETPGLTAAEIRGCGEEYADEVILELRSSAVAAGVGKSPSVPDEPEDRVWGIFGPDGELRREEEDPVDLEALAPDEQARVVVRSLPVGESPSGAGVRDEKPKPHDVLREEGGSIQAFLADEVVIADMLENGTFWDNPTVHFQFYPCWYRLRWTTPAELADPDKLYELFPGDDLDNCDTSVVYEPVPDEVEDAVLYIEVREISARTPEPEAPSTEVVPASSPARASSSPDVCAYCGHGRDEHGHGTDDFPDGCQHFREEDAGSGPFGEAENNEGHCLCPNFVPAPAVPVSPVGDEEGRFAVGDVVRVVDLPHGLAGAVGTVEIILGNGNVQVHAEGSHPSESWTAQYRPGQLDHVPGAQGALEEGRSAPDEQDEKCNRLFGGSFYSGTPSSACALPKGHDGACAGRIAGRSGGQETGT